MTNTEVATAMVVPDFPRVTAEFSAEGDVRVSVQSAERTFTGPTARDEALRYLHGVAAKPNLRRPIRVRTTAPGDYHSSIIITPDGTYYDEGNPAEIFYVPAGLEPVATPAPAPAQITAADQASAAPDAADPGGPALPPDLGGLAVTAAIGAVQTSESVDEEISVDEVSGIDASAAVPAAAAQTPAGGGRWIKRLCVVAAVILLLAAGGSAVVSWLGHDTGTSSPAIAPPANEATEPALPPSAGPSLSTSESPAPKPVAPTARAIAGQGTVTIRARHLTRGAKVLFTIRAGGKVQRKRLTVKSATTVAWTARKLPPGRATWLLRTQGRTVHGHVIVKAKPKPHSDSAPAGSSSGTYSGSGGSDQSGTKGSTKGHGKGGGKPHVGDTPAGPKSPTTQGPGAPSLPVAGRLAEGSPR